MQLEYCMILLTPPSNNNTSNFTIIIINKGIILSYVWSACLLVTLVLLPVFKRLIVALSTHTFLH